VAGPPFLYNKQCGKSNWKGVVVISGNNQEEMAEWTWIDKNQRNRGVHTGFDSPKHWRVELPSPTSTSNLFIKGTLSA
jgi:hypothetical protein